MPGPTTLLDGIAPASPPPPTGGGPVTPGPYSQAVIGPAVGTAPLTGTHNATLHVAVYGLGWLGVILLMHKWGFRLVSVGRYGGR